VAAEVTEKTCGKSGRLAGSKEKRYREVQENYQKQAGELPEKKKHMHTEKIEKP
jgi:hypothetical protein